MCYYFYFITVCCLFTDFFSEAPLNSRQAANLSSKKIASWEYASPRSLTGMVHFFEISLTLIEIVNNTCHIIINNQMIGGFYCGLNIKTWSDTIPAFHDSALRISGAYLICFTAFHLCQRFSELDFPAFQII